MKKAQKKQDQAPLEFSDDEPEEFEFDKQESDNSDSFDSENEEEPEEGISKETADPEKKRLERIEQKKVKLERKMAKPNSEVILDAKQLWEKLRQKSLEKKERIELMDKMMAIVSGKASDVIFYLN